MNQSKNWDIKVPHFYCMEYYEDDRKLIVDMDFRDPIYYLNLQLIEHW